MAFTPFGSDCVSTRVADPAPRPIQRLAKANVGHASKLVADAWDGDAALRDLRCPTCGREAVREDGWPFWLRVRVAAHDEGA